MTEIKLFFVYFKTLKSPVDVCGADLLLFVLVEVLLVLVLSGCKVSWFLHDLSVF